VQISKVCQKSKFQIKFEMILFLESGHFRFSAEPWPTSLPPPFSQATAHLSPSPFCSSLHHRLPLTDRQARPVNRLAVFFLQRPDRPLPPPPARAATAPMTPPLPEMAPHFPPLHSPLTPLFPSPPNWMAGIDAATIGRLIPFPVQPPRFPSDPIKG
jgi:hypothetical protein